MTKNTINTMITLTDKRDRAIKSTIKSLQRYEAENQNLRNMLVKELTKDGKRKKFLGIF